jgi:RNA-directed DNA polymerase
VGIFDWLFGRKKKDDSRHSSGFAQSQAAHDRREPFINVPGTPVKRERTAYLSWRKRRSRQPVAPVEEQWIPASVWSGKVRGVAQFGGIASKPSKTGNPRRIEALGLPNIEHFEELAALLGEAVNPLLQYVIRNGRTVRHYLPRRVPKKSGGTRLLLVPKPRLKGLQRALCQKLVRKLPLSEAAHGFRNGRDVLTGATNHVAREVVICMDVEDFFPSFDFRRVSGYFRTVGYSRGVAVALANLTTVAPVEIEKVTRYDEAVRAHRPQLPQGAPTSPGIANAICWRMDKRLSALAHKFGGDYTRYADDLTFSGGEDMAANAGKLVALVRRIVKTEGLALNEKKTRVMRRGRQQRVTGVVVNEKTNVSRRDFDLLKAILHNCIKHGPADQNRENVPDFRGHLRGRIAHVTHIGPERGRKLMRMFEQIVW